jgi:ERCC4-type nuclease
MFVCQIDSRERKNDHIKVAFDKAGIAWFVSKLPCGDYADFDRQRVTVERKGSIQEICGNLAQVHERFRAELIRAERIGIQIILLIENSESIKTLSDVRHWVNPRLALSKYALSGFELYRRMVTVSNRYNLPIFFCEPSQTGATILNILEHPGNYKLLGGN